MSCYTLPCFALTDCLKYIQQGLIEHDLFLKGQFIWGIASYNCVFILVHYPNCKADNDFNPFERT